VIDTVDEIIEAQVNPVLVTLRVVGPGPQRLASLVNTRHASDIRESSGRKPRILDDCAAGMKQERIANLIHRRSATRANEALGAPEANDAVGLDRKRAIPGRVGRRRRARKAGKPESRKAGKPESMRIAPANVMLFMVVSRVAINGVRY
jgi:hypothetical protein